jgi:hypothetical protein
MKRITTIITLCSLAVTLGCKKECTSGQRFVVQSSMKVMPQTTEILLGDTLTITVEVPYNSFDLQKNIPVNTASFKVSEFGLQLGIINRMGDKLVGEGPEQFTVLFQKGGGSF